MRDQIKNDIEIETHAPAGISRRQFLALGSLSVVAPLAPFSAFASTYPSRPISLIVGGDAGGSVDFGARALSKPLSDILGVSIIVENKPGATGVISSKYVANAPADGYNLLVSTPSAAVVGPQTQPKSAFQPLKDIVGINMVARNPMAVAINPSLKIDALQDLVALSRTRPVTLGVPGLGGMSDLLVKQISKFTGGVFESIPYKGMGAAINDAVGGQIDGVASDLGPFMPFHQAGRLKILAVTSDERVASLPNIPTASENYPGLVVYNWLGIFMSSKTPPDIIDKINAALQKIVAHDDGTQKLFSQSANVLTSMKSPAEFQEFVASEYARWGAVLKEHGMAKS